MNTNNLKKYAPQARRDFMAAVSQRLNQFGIHADSKGKLTISTPVVSGSVMQIEGLSFDAGLARAREKLAQRAERMGFEALVEQMAYTWFNRLSAIRFMELHGYLDHNLRVLSHPEKANSFEILDHAQDVATDLGLDRNHIVELKLAGNQDEALYRLLLLGQCHQLHQAMPFLFEALDDETELLLPDNLTRTDSILRGLVDSIPENDWQQVEIIGWLYQFYISEKKDQVIGSVVKSEDIPAATQLFTPNWIVKYLVQNSVGRQWLMTYPDSGLKAQMEYYIEPAEQEPSVVEALAAITPISIDPETLKVLDPACGSGHILVEAYDILKAIYEERGYRVRDIPELILEKNLYGLDIDDRAAQLAGFALMMKAREDDRRIFTRDIKLNVLAIQSTQNLDLLDLWRKLALDGNAQRGETFSIFDEPESVGRVSDSVTRQIPPTNVGLRYANPTYAMDFDRLQSILALFEQAKTLGSLIQVPHDQSEYLRNLTSQLQALAEQGDSMQKQAAIVLLPYVQQAWLLAQQYDAVVANPPYMGNKGMNIDLKKYSEIRYPKGKGDLFGCFIERGIEFTVSKGFCSMVTMQAWLFINTYEELREEILKSHSIINLVQIGFNSFPELNSKYALAAAFAILKNVKKQDGFFISLNDAPKSSDKKFVFFHKKNTNQIYKVNSFDFNYIEGKPIAFEAPSALRKAFHNFHKLRDLAEPRQGMATADNDRFVRIWTEVSYKKIGFNFVNRESAKTSKLKWFPYNKGGGFRKWYGNQIFVVNWENDGKEIFSFSKSVVRNADYYFKEGITWSLIGLAFSPRYIESGFIFDVGGSSAFPHKDSMNYILAFMNSNVSEKCLEALNPTLNYQVGDIQRLPIPSLKKQTKEKVEELSASAIEISKSDWNSYETSWAFSINPLIKTNKKNIKTSFNFWKNTTELEFENLKSCQEAINSIFIEAFELQDQLSPEIAEEQVTLNRADCELDIQRLISYAIGCMMGRYSLDEPGLIYAHAGNVDFDPSRYPSFPADEDGILPLTDQEWFKDDATNRFREFLLAVWGEDTLQQNLEFVAESLGLSSFKPKKGETSLDTVRRYLSNQFYKDHLQTYKKRPIYWLFSSGKQKAFECLVYLHRYNDSTLARMRTEYVTPLLGKYSAYADQLNQQLQDASSSEATPIKNKIKELEKKQTELRQFDDKLKHYADMRIKLDLDDGVKVNYGKFGDLLAEVKAVTGGSE
jgi:type II restriction/modification system DNA methylase subunit YeeA